MKKTNTIIIGILSLLLLYLIYYQGFYGGFLLDDKANLSKLQLFQQSTGIDKYINYLLSSASGILKRPIANLTFLLHTSDWPADAYYFKLVSFIFHVINGFLLYVVSTLILNLLKVDKNKIVKVALLSSMIWVLHPYFVSTVLYPVQRMAILPVTFTLIAFIFYGNGRRLLNTDKKEASLYLFISVFIFTSLAALSKENGILLPLLLFIFEIIIVRHSGLPNLTKVQKYVLFYFPIFVITMALVYKIPSFLDQYLDRDFSLIERLLTQCRVLVLYMYHFIVPEYFTEGVYTDGYIKSTGMLNPITTLISFIIIITLLISSIIFRFKYKLFSFAVLFYFASNIIESTFIPLELYFEHRSYLSTLFLPLGFSLVIISLVNKNKIFITTPIIVISFLSITTYKKTELWGDNINLHVKTAEKFPESVRASTIAAALLDSNGERNKAVLVLQKAMEKHNKIELEANILNFKCNDSKLVSNDFTQLIHKLRNENFYYGDSSPFTGLIKSLLNSKCIDNGGEIAILLLENLVKNKRYENQLIKYYTIRLFSYAHIVNKDFENGYVSINTFINHAKRLPKLTWSMEIVSLYMQHDQWAYAKKVLDDLTPYLEEDKQDVYFYNKRAKNIYQYIEKKLND